jgi:hypothetical protein
MKLGQVYNRKKKDDPWKAEVLAYNGNQIFIKATGPDTKKNIGFNGPKFLFVSEEYFRSKYAQ